VPGRLPSSAGRQKQGCPAGQISLHEAFRDNYAAFEKSDAVVLGVSVDPVKSHDKFATKFELPFPLVSDEDRKIVEAYGVWGEKQFMGRTYDGTHRVTFLISPAGSIARIWPKVKPAEHAAEVLDAIAQNRV